jgi:hypothetical protein
MGFQAAASTRITEALQRREAAGSVVADINGMFRDSF